MPTRDNDAKHTSIDALACSLVLALTLILSSCGSGAAEPISSGASATPATSASASTTSSATVSTTSSSRHVPTATPVVLHVGDGSGGDAMLWSTLAGNDTSVLLYQRSSFTAAVARIDGSGKLVILQMYAGSMGSWTHIVGVRDMFFFYNRDNHAGAVARIGADGSLVTIKQYPAGSFSDWTDIAGADCYLLFYNSNTCHPLRATLTADGTLTNQSDVFNKFTPCGALAVATKRGDFLLYIPSSRYGQFITVTNSTGTASYGITNFGIWTHIAGTSDLFFYNRANHHPYVGQWDAIAGKFTNVHGYNAGAAPDFNLLAAVNDHIIYYNNDPSVHAGGVWKLNEDGTLTGHTTF